MIVGIEKDKDGKIIQVCFDKGSQEEKEEIFKELMDESR